MAASVVIAGAWDFSTYGACTATVAWDGGVSTANITFSSGSYEPGTICVDAGVASPALSSFATAFGAALAAAAPLLGFGCTWSTTTGRYTITNGGDAFDLTFSGAAGARMRALLGLSTDIVAAADSVTGDMVPWYVIVPAIAGLTADSGVTRRSGVSKTATNANGGRYVLRPTSIPRVRSWEHHFEPKERVDADYLAVVATSSHYYSWEQLWTDYGTAMLPIGMQVVDSAGNIETTAFSLDTPEYDRSVKTRMRPNDDVRWKIHVDATLWPGASANSYARAFS